MLALVHGSDNVRTCHACVCVPVCIDMWCKYDKVLMLSICPGETMFKDK